MERTINSHVIDFLASRKSAPIGQLGLPGPGEEDIRTMLQIASRVPDHGKLAPWRFIVFSGDARKAVSEATSRIFATKQTDDVRDIRLGYLCLLYCLCDFAYKAQKFHADPLDHL